MIGIATKTASALGAIALVAGSPADHADPSTPLAVIESSASQLCAAIDVDPTDDGVAAGMELGGAGLDEMDNAMVLISAIHHVCPQHEDLVMGLMGCVAADEVCEETW